MKLIIAAGFLILALVPLSLAQPVFGPPVNLGPRINTASREEDPFLTADGKRLFFSDGSDIWFSEWLNNNWTQAVKLGSQINYSSFFQKSPSVSPDGQKLYYVDVERGGRYWDIWVSTWDSSINDWGTTQNLGWPVNTPGVEFSARIGPDGQHLYFTSLSDSVDSLNPDGRCGIYMSEWNETNWSIPQFQWGCGTPEYPSVSANGLWLYFDAYVPDGKSIFVTSWKDSTWGFPAIDLRSELGGRSGTPFITPSGDSLFFAGSTTDLGGFGITDIWMSKRLPPGDLNLDSQLTAADVVLELNKVFLNEPYPAPEGLGDLNCDTIFSPADVVLILNRVFLGTLSPC